MTLHPHGEAIDVPVVDATVVVVGSGAAGLNAAIHCAEAGVDPGSVAIITDEWGGGTSYNAGSDKQTYYKLSIAGEGADSPLAMARDLFSGGSMHGDIALAEAAGSIEEFFHLVRIGIEFPRNELGLYPGYRTDNDTRQRATSVGPYTSRMMVEALAREAARLGIGLLDGHVAVRILVAGEGTEKRVAGVACIDVARAGGARAPVTSMRDVPVVIVRAPAVVLATGGPANIYQASAYPPGQRCAHSLGIEAGAAMQNLAFMQFGIASKKFRWNLSGSFQQVIPAYWVEGPARGERVELLHGWLPSAVDAAFQTFLKGYNWPFDPSKCDRAAQNHSSIVDLAVHDAVVQQGKNVYMDFRSNPWDITGEPFPMADLPAEAKDYIGVSTAALATPIERLDALNPLAIQVFADHGIDLRSEPLEIHVAAQHCNGGFTGTINWESTNVRGLYPVGEANGTHGRHRPGGAALNAGQVGGLRAARHIAGSHSRASSASIAAIEIAAKGQLEPLLARLRPGGRAGAGEAIDPQTALAEVGRRMDAAGGIVRSAEGLRRARDAARDLVTRLEREAVVADFGGIVGYLETRDAAITHHVVLAAMAEQLAAEPGVHPCYVVACQDGEAARDIVARLQGTRGPPPGLPNRILETRVLGHGIAHSWVEARPVPDEADWFEGLMKRGSRA
ncbi:MAG: FAD-binding protein [Candidatus Lokiarchaeota archaeon]|nr:FAD-binding protein [Candidatus Lokiarchaeota archaeon]